MTADTTQSQCQSLFNKHCRKKKMKPRTSTGLSLRSVKFIVRFSPIASVPKSSWPLDISGRWCITCTCLHFVTGAVFKTLLFPISRTVNWHQSKKCWLQFHRHYYVHVIFQNCMTVRKQTGFYHWL